MNIARKLEIAKQSILSISAHDDEESEIVHAALLEVAEIAKSEADNLMEGRTARAELQETGTAE